MAQLMFISETGMFHSACRTTIGTQVKWYGFKPKAHMTPAGAGFVDTSDRTAMMNHSITFEVNDALLRMAITAVTAKYADRTYVVTVCDCVSFAADVARQVRLRVPPLNLTPYGFIQVLALWNKYLAKT